MDPITIAMLAGTVFTTISQSNAQRAQANFQSEMMMYNARESQRMSSKALDLGNLEAQKYQGQIDQMVGKQKAGYAAGGIDVGFGSAKDVMNETRVIGAQDVENIRTNAYLTAMGYRSQAQSQSMQADFTRSAGNMSANTTLLAGGLDAARIYKQYK